VISAEQIAIEQSHGHSIFGASGWKKKLLCAGSTLAEIGQPNSETIYAATGTVAHRIAESVLRGELKTAFDYPEGLVWEGGYQIRVDRIFLDYIQQHVDLCKTLIGEVYIEQRVDLSDWTPIPDQGGFADYGVCRFRHLTVVDLKFGEGVKVYAKMNPQPIGYALGFIKAWDWLYAFETVTIIISQPRLGHFDRWETTVDELMVAGVEIKAGLAATWVEDAPRTPGGEQCQFCRARPTCKAAVAIVQRIADATFDDETGISGQELVTAGQRLVPASDVVLPDPRRMPTGLLGRFLSYRKVLERAFIEAAQELEKRLLHGEEAEGWMVAQGHRSRSIDETEIDGIVSMFDLYDVPKADLFEPSVFRSPAQLEELLMKAARISKKRAEKILAPYVKTERGRDLLAPSKPGKVAAVSIADDCFDDESGL
jgi:hypothetical protein